MFETGVFEVRLGMEVAALVLGCLTVVGCAQTGAIDATTTAADPPPEIAAWEWWRDLASVGSVPDGDQTVMRSSHCPTGCEFDRHSEGDSRFIRVRENGEGVIFSTEGAGAVTRIWMVMGHGVSRPLDPSIRLRVRIDGRRRPVIDLPLPDVFSGTVAPFLAPMVADRTVSGGGNVSYVPIPFVDGCEIALVGADESKIWFQVNARLVDDVSGLRPFTGRESLAGFRSLLERTGSDPWPGGPFPTIGGSTVVAPGGAEVIADLTGPDVVNGIIIRARRADWDRLGLRFAFDDREPFLVPLLDLFGVARASLPAARSLFFGADQDDDLYFYLPLPFFDRAVIEIVRRSVEGPPGVSVEYAVRRSGAPPADDAGYFGVQITDTENDAGDAPAGMIELEGRGSLVGVFASFGPASGDDWGYLEADERIFLDGEAAPSWHGTGVEDFFGGGFYFRSPNGRPQPFTQPLHGAPAVWFHDRAFPVMYRLMFGDAVVFERGLRAELETGANGVPSVRRRTVGFYYLRLAESDETSPASTPNQLNR